MILALAEAAKNLKTATAKANKLIKSPQFLGAFLF